MTPYPVKGARLPIPFHRLLKVVVITDHTNPQIQGLVDCLTAERCEIEISTSYDRDVSEDAAVGAYIALVDGERLEPARRLGKAVREIGFRTPLWALADSHRITDLGVFDITGEVTGYIYLGQQSPDLEHFVLKSSTTVYGSSSRDPAMFSEDMAARRIGAVGFVKDLNEVEGYVRGFARRRPDVRVTTLRTASAIGPTLNTPLTAYFKLPVIPTVLGFDPRMQFLNDTDLLDAIEHTTLSDVRGTFNVAGDGVLMLSQAIRRLGRPALPLPGFAVGAVGSAMRQARLADFSPEAVAFLAYGRGVDTTRMREVLGFQPSRTTEQAFAEFLKNPARRPWLK